MVMASRRRRKTCSDSSADASAVKSSNKRPTTSARPTAQHAAAYLDQHLSLKSCHKIRTIKVYPTSFNSSCAEIRLELSPRKKSLLYGFEPGLTLVDTYFLSHEDMNSLLSQSAMIEAVTSQGFKDQNIKVPLDRKVAQSECKTRSVGEHRLRGPSSDCRLVRQCPD